MWYARPELGLEQLERLERVTGRNWTRSRLGAARRGASYMSWKGRISIGDLLSVSSTAQQPASSSSALHSLQGTRPASCWGWFPQKSKTSPSGPSPPLPSPPRGAPRGAPSAPAKAARRRRAATRCLRLFVSTQFFCSIRSLGAAPCELCNSLQNNNRSVKTAGKPPPLLVCIIAVCLVREERGITANKARLAEMMLFVVSCGTSLQTDGVSCFRADLGILRGWSSPRDPVPESRGV